MRKLVGALAIVVLAAHLAGLPRSLEDIDSVNFAMGVRDLDVAQHQPHPPGYPVYIALAKLSTAALDLAGVAHADVRGLAVWGALGAALLAPFVFLFVRAIDGDDRRAAIAALLTVCSPLVWFNAARPMSDTIGFAIAAGALAALAVPAADPARSTWQGVAGALLAGLSVGIRSQMAFVTGPLLVLAWLRSRRKLAILAAAAAGILVWAIPLVVLTGGPAAYLRALGSQAGEDFAGVVMLWTNPTPRVAFFAAMDTFVRPWDSPLLGGAVVALAVGGAAWLVVRAPRALAIAVLTFAPYAVFHLLFQEPLTTRYALPLIPLVAYLAAVILAEAPAVYAWTGAAAVAGASLALAGPATAAFDREPSPAFSLLSEIGLLRDRGAEPVVGMHRRVFTETRRPRAYAGNPPGTLLPAPRDYEWLELTRTWREGFDGESWFLADPRRTDLALVDRSHARVREYRWPFNAPVYVGGVRPNEIDWYILNQPQWFLERGWALTPEVAGITDRDGGGPHRQPSLGYVRRRGTDSVMMIGGRHLGGEPPVIVTVSVDDRPIASFDVKPGYFLQFVDVPAGALAGEGRFGALKVIARAVSGATPAVAIEQFDFQPRDRVVFGIDEGWFEPEFNPATARSWRWSGERASVRIHNAGQSVKLRIAGENPLHYFDEAPLVQVRAGDRLLAELRPSGDFRAEVAIPADALAAADGRVTITSDRAFVAGEREGTGDRRRLALRIYAVSVGQ